LNPQTIACNTLSTAFADVPTVQKSNPNPKVQKSNPNPNPNFNPNPNPQIQKSAVKYNPNLSSINGNNAVVKRSGISKTRRSLHETTLRQNQTLSNKNINNNNNINNNDNKNNDNNNNNNDNNKYNNNDSNKNNNNNNSSTYNKWFEASGDPCIVHNVDNEDMNEGSWFFAPYKCRYHFYTKPELNQCLAFRNITHIHFHGDSMSRDIYLYVARYLGISVCIYTYTHI
jgi:hypothetical protein